MGQFTSTADERTCWQHAATRLPEFMQRFVRDWKGLTSIGQVITVTQHQGKETFDVRHYISSRSAKVKEFATATRGHWNIESMHWVLDVVLAEDDSRIRNGDGPENFGCLRKFVLSLLKRDTSEGSLKRKRKRAACSTEFLESLLFEYPFDAMAVGRWPIGGGELRKWM